jgi:putative transposase
MLRAIKVRLYPNITQENYINKLLGSYRFVYNQSLNKKINEYNNSKINHNLTSLGKFFHNDLTKNPDFIWLQEHNTKILKQSIIDLLDAYSRFFKQGSGFPKFKSKHDKQSCRFPLEAISKKQDFSKSKINLSNLKDLKFKTSNKYINYLIKNQSNIKSATLSKNKSNEFYLSILIDGDLLKQLDNPINFSIGIDLGIKDFVITSKGDKFENIKLIRNNKEKLSKLQKQHSRKKKGSKNKEKARKRLARFHQHLTNIKENYLHKVSNTLLNENQVICMENLNVSGIMKNHKLARSIQELSLYRFESILKYKSVWYDRAIINIDRFYPSSKTCSDCGYINHELKLSDREWICPDCGVLHDRDLNASINIEQEGLKIYNEQIGQRLPEFTLVDNPTMDDRLSNEVLKSSGWLKQEEKTKIHNFS